jgi:alkylation response protein AidB-like acyl-CoA dehydrogenase
VTINAEPATCASGELVAASPERRDLFTVCRRLQTEFAGRAAEHDREGTFPTEDFAALKREGLTSLLVPQGSGGWGADYATYTRVAEILAQGNASTALAFNMHCIVIGALGEVDLENVPGRRAQSMLERREWVYQEARAGRVFASASSEPEAGFRLRQLKTTYHRVEGGYIINGVKSFVSMAGHADYYVVAARSEQMVGEVPGVSYFIVDREHPQVEVRDVWDTLGMRATCSNTLILNQCFVPNNRLFLLEGVALYKLTREPHWLAGAYNGVYLGLAAAALDFVVQFLREKAGGKFVADPLVQHRVGELSVQLEATRSVVYDAADRVVRNRSALETYTAIHRAKFLVGELGPWLASEAIRLCGGASISKRFPLERYYRDARCGGLMPARSDDCLTYVGRALLGVDIADPTQSYW